MEWSKSVFQPNEEATLSIKTSPNALCSLSAVDESTKFRSSDNFSIRKLLERLSERGEGYYYDYYNNNCPKSQQDRYVWEPEIYSDKDTAHLLQVTNMSAECVCLYLNTFFRNSEYLRFLI